MPAERQSDWEAINDEPGLRERRFSSVTNKQYDVEQVAFFIVFIYKRKG